jgi:hypothetical protein
MVLPFKKHCLSEMAVVAIGAFNSLALRRMYQSWIAPGRRLIVEGSRAPHNLGGRVLARNIRVISFLAIE